MTRNFVYSASPTHIDFGPGRAAAIGEWVERIGCRRALILSTPRAQDEAGWLRDFLGIARPAYLPGR